MSRTLSPGLAAALALGATVGPALQAADESAVTAGTEATPAAAPAAAEAAAPAVPVAPAATDPPPVEATNASAAEPAPVVATPAAADTSGQNALVAHLKEEATTARNALAELTLKHTQAQASLASVQGDVTLLLPVVQESAKRLCIALNIEPVGIDAMSASTLATYFGKLDGQFKSKFKIGAQADTGARVEEPKATATASNDPVTDLQAARVRSATVGKK